MSPTATAARPAKKSAAVPASVPGYAGKLLRVNLSTGKIWTQPWAEDMGSPSEMRCRWRKATGSSLRARAICSIWDSMAKMVWGAPGAR